MASNKNFHDYVTRDVLAGIRGITTRAMFGGWGIYKDGLFFALIAEDRLFFKVDESNLADYQRQNSKPFVYHAPGGKAMKMSYWELPESVAENKQAVREWVDRAVAVAKKAKKKK